MLCTGATQPRDLPIEGRKLKGVHFAMEYLTASTKALLNGGPDTPDPSREGKDVIVIGGGDTGTDCVGTAMRQGCKSLTQLEIMPRPPMDRAADNPWPEWPKVYKLDYGQEEAAAKFGADPRAYLTTVKRSAATTNGAGQGNRHRADRVGKNEKGQFVPVEVPGTEHMRPAQLVLLAMGFLGPEQMLLEGSRGRARPAQQRESGARQVRDQHSGRLRRRRLSSRPKPGGVGDQRRPRRRARVRPLLDGQHRAAMKRVYNAANHIQAHMVMHVLEQAGVHAMVQGEFLQSGAGELPLGNLVGVAVDDEDVAIAREIIEDWEKLMQEPGEEAESG